MGNSYPLLTPYDTEEWVGCVSHSQPPYSARIETSRFPSNEGRSTNSAGRIDINKAILLLLHMMSEHLRALRPRLRSTFIGDFGARDLMRRASTAQHARPPRAMPDRSQHGTRPKRPCGARSISRIPVTNGVRSAADSYSAPSTEDEQVCHSKT